MKFAFGGHMGVGKDESVKYLKNKYKGTHISFAQPLYDIMKYAQTIAGFPLEKDRKFLQWVGTEWGRNIQSDVWVNAALRKTPVEGNVFISDLRFVNEFEALKDNDWVCIKLVRDHPDGREGTGSTEHISEHVIDSIPDDRWDYIINNNGTLDMLHRKLDHIVYLTIINNWISE